MYPVRRMGLPEVYSYRTDSEILTFLHFEAFANLRSCWHRFQSVYVFWQGCMFLRQQKFRSGSRSWIPACCWLLG
jgi:hypothetical protein